MTIQQILDLLNKLLVALGFYVEEKEEHESIKDHNPYDDLMSRISYVLNIRLNDICSDKEDKDCIAISVLTEKILKALRTKVIEIEATNLEGMSRSEIYRFIVHKTNDFITIGEGNAILAGIDIKEVMKHRKIFTDNIPFFLKTLELLLILEEYSKREGIKVVYVLYIALLEIMVTDIEKKVLLDGKKT